MLFRAVLTHQASLPIILEVLSVSRPYSVIENTSVNNQIFFEEEKHILPFSLACKINSHLKAGLLSINLCSLHLYWVKKESVIQLNLGRVETGFKSEVADQGSPLVLSLTNGDSEQVK